MKDMTKFINYIIGFILLIMCIMNIVLVKDLEEKTVDLIELSNSKSEVIILDSLVYDTVYIDRYQKVLVPVISTDTINDTILVVDSIEVNIPIQKKHYSDTLAETAFSFDLSGYLPEVNNLYVQNLKVCPEPQKQPKKWFDNIHIGAGFSATYYEGFKILPSIGIYYSLF